MLPREVLRKIRRIEIRTSHLVNESFAGEYHSVFKGRGMEFSEVREYSPGDDVRIIDWNVTSRLGTPYVKVFVEERELTVLLLVDTSASFAFGTRDRLKGALCAELTAVLAFSAVKNNDRVGAVLFTDRVETFIPPRKGRRHVLRTIREVLAFRPEGRRTDVSCALDFLLRVQKKKAVVFLVSDFLDDDYERSLRIARQKHDMVPVVVTDRLEEEGVPRVGILELEDPETGRVVLVDTGSRRVRRALNERIRARADARDETFRTLGLESIHVRTGEPYEVPLVRFFERRARRIRG